MEASGIRVRTPWLLKGYLCLGAGANGGGEADRQAEEEDEEGQGGGEGGEEQTGEEMRR